MSASCYRIFLHSHPGRKNAGNAVTIITLCRYGNKQSVKVLYLALIRFQIDNRIGVLQHQQQIAIQIRLCNVCSDCLLHIVRNSYRLTMIGRKVHDKCVSISLNFEYPDLRLKIDFFRLFLIKSKQHIRCTQCCMPAEINFSTWSEPAKMIDPSLLL